MNQIQLTDIQAVILSAACAREDGLIFPITSKVKGGAVGNICKSLLKRSLIEEVEASDLSTVWRHDGERGPITLRATRLAYDTLGITDDDEVPEGVADESVEAPAIERRKGSKQAMLIEMLKTPEGASIQQIVEATGWQAHTVRGAISGALKKKLGLEVTSEKVDGRGRVYRLC